MRLAAALALLAPACQALLACSGPADPAWLPRVEGAVWEYELRSAQGIAPVRVEALGEREIPGREGRVFLVEETRASGPGFDAVNPVGYVVEAGYLARLEGLVYDGQGRLRVLGDGVATRILPLDARPGARWTQETSIFSAAGGEGVRQRWEAEVRSRGAIDVPAGRFEDVVEVHTTLRDESGAVRGRYRDVFARDVGLVYGESIDAVADASQREELRLLRYRVPE